MKDLYDENGMIELKKGVIDGTFCVEGMEVAKISNDYIGEEDVLAFGKIAFENYGYVLKPLNDEEYQKAADKYNALVDLFV